MKRFSRIGLVISLLVSIGLTGSGTLLELKQELMSAITRSDSQTLKQVRRKFLQAQPSPDKQYLQHYYIALSDYMLTSMFRTQKDSALHYLNDAVEHLKQCLELEPDFAEGYALLSSSYGRKIGFHPMSGIYLGPRAGAAIGKALQLEPENPRVNLLAGINMIFTPKMFGGGKDKARLYLKRAEQYFRTYQPADSLAPNWGHRDVYGWLAYLAMEEDSLNLAETYCQKALEISPQFHFVRDYLLPEIHKKKKDGHSS
jgi:tetratricopeptide (TPR) repeat protein